MAGLSLAALLQRVPQRFVGELHKPTEGQAEFEDQVEGRRRGEDADYDHAEQRGVGWRSHAEDAEDEHQPDDQHDQERVRNRIRWLGEQRELRLC